MPRILVIDDSAFFRKTVRGFLEEAGFEVDDFLPLSALEVLERVRAWLPDVVITDYNMPYVDGQAVARMVRRHAKDLPIVVLTAARDPERESRLKGFEPLQVVHKPITGPELVERVKAIRPA